MIPKLNQSQQCSICGLDSLLTPVAPSLVDHISGEIFERVRCEPCNFVFLRSPPSVGEISKYYSNEAGGLMHQTPHPIVAFLQRTLFSIELRHFMGHLGSQAAVLDIGAGDGAMVRYLRDRGYHAEARDFYPETQWRSTNIPYKMIDFVDPNPKPFLTVDGQRPQAVVMRHVLEHLHDPLRVLERLHAEHISLLYLVVPNLDALGARMFPQSWFYWDPPRHISHFSRESLQKIAHAAGYKILKINYYGIDELVSTLYRFVGIAKTQNKTWIQKIPQQLFSPKGILAALSSGISFLPLRTVCSAVLRREP